MGRARQGKVLGMTVAEPPSVAAVHLVPLSRLFANTTNSCKLLLFQAILNVLPRYRSGTGHVRLPLRLLVIEMAALAWFPKTFFHLSFGMTDQLGAALERLDFSVAERRLGNA